ncbi:hypothetical protein BXZ70DRAFT_1004004 [Cristinia sonorae]|uniref:U4/U6.U5 small nuclear ribonucleoprotein 27kDa protein domain-containing protein n=1 Tax=Cristinia sonorae TaxID=1940300 RepID=A0A8K0UYP0_9AGAR|nr:hypothetical protein BXZ70DRAFT_1004004 [Cristinia sonorae]
MTIDDATAVVTETGIGIETEIAEVGTMNLPLPLVGEVVAQGVLGEVTGTGTGTGDNLTLAYGTSDRRDYGRDYDDDRRDRDRDRRDVGRRDDRDRERREKEREARPDVRRDSREPPRASEREREREGEHKQPLPAEEKRSVPPEPSSSSHAAPADQVRQVFEGHLEDGEESEAMDATGEDDAAMMAMMGLSGFGTTKGKKVEGNQEGAVDVKKMRTWRQYMNRRGGFNRPLDKIK